MRTTRLLNLSLVYNYKDFLHSEGYTTEAQYVASGFPYIPVLAKDQAYRDLSSPCYVIYPSNVVQSELQIGGGYWIKTVVNFDIFGETEAQMMEMVDLARQFVSSQMWLNDYEGNVPSYQVYEGLVRTYYENGSPSALCSVFFENMAVVFMNRANTIGEASAHSAQLTAVAIIPTI